MMQKTLNLMGAIATGVFPHQRCLCNEAVLKQPTLLILAHLFCH